MPLAVHFKQHSSLTYQNPFYKITDFGYAKTTRQLVNETTRRAAVGITELWNYGITELRNHGTTDLRNKGLEGIEGIEQLLMKHSCGCHS